MGGNSVVPKRVNKEIAKALPFEPVVPNKKTIAAIEAARRGEFER